VTETSRFLWFAKIILDNLKPETFYLFES